MSAPLNHISTLPADHTVTITDPHGATVATFTLTQPARLTITQPHSQCDMQQYDTQPSCEHADALRMEHVGTYIIDLDDLDDTVPEVAQLSSALDAFLTATGNIDAGDARATQRDNEYSDEAFKDLEALRKHATPRNTHTHNISADAQAGNITTVITPSDDAYCIISEYGFADAIEFAQRHALTTRVAIEHDEYGYATYTGVPQLRATDFVIELTDDLTGATLELVDTTAPEYASGTLLDNRTIRELIFWSHPANDEHGTPQQPVSVPFDTFVKIVESQQKDNDSDTASTRNAQAHNDAAQRPTEDFGRITITADILNGEVQYVDRGTQEPVDDADVINAVMLAYEHELAMHATFRVPDCGLTAYQGTIASGNAYGKNPNTLFVIDPRIGGAEVIAPDGTLAPDMRHLAQLTIYSDDRAKACVDTTPPLNIATFVDIVRNNAHDDNAHATHNTDDTASNTPATLTAADLDTVDTVFNELIGSGIAFSAIAHMDKYHMCALRTSHGDFVDVSHVNDRYDAAQMLDILADAADETLSVIAVFASPYAEETYIGKLKWDNEENELFISDNSHGDVVIAYLNENDEFCAEDVFAKLSYIRVFSDAKMRRNGFAGTNDAQYDLVPVAAFRDKL